MIEYFKTTPEGTQIVEEPEPGCWVNVVAPTPEERAWLSNTLGVIPEFVASALDDEERSHTDYDDDTNQVLVIADCPCIEDMQEAEDATITQYDTHPLSFLFLPEKDVIVTVSLRDNRTISVFSQGTTRRSFNSNQRTRLLLQMMLHIAHGYVTYLRNIERQFNTNEKKLRETMRNEELIKMLGFEKSLVYFSTSLRSNEATLLRIASGRVVKLYDDDRDLLDDVLIEVRQAMEMCTILTQILNSTMETFSSVINNNLNVTMRRLTVLTLILAIPTIIFSFYGMNVEGLPFMTTFWPAVAIAIVGCTITYIFLKKSKMFQ